MLDRLPLMLFLKVEKHPFQRIRIGYYKIISFHEKKLINKKSKHAITDKH